MQGGLSPGGMSPEAPRLKFEVQIIGPSEKEVFKFINSGHELGLSLLIHFPTDKYGNYIIFEYQYLIISVEDAYALNISNRYLRTAL